MDDEGAPRLAPPPKPTLLQHTVPRPEVPEISLMFDSDDSLIWQRSGFERSKNNGLQQQYRKSFQSSGLSLKGISPARHDVDTSEKENNPQVSPQINLAQIPHKTQVQRFISGNSRGSEVHKKSEQHQFQESSSPSYREERTDTSDSKRHYNPLLYSPSQKIADKVSRDVPNHLVKQVSPLTTRNNNIMQQKQPSAAFSVPISVQTGEELDFDGINSYVTKQSKSLPTFKKVVHFDKNSPSSLETAVRPKVTNDQERSIDAYVHQRKDDGREGLPSASQDKMFYGRKGMQMQPNTGYMNANVYGDPAPPSNIQIPQARYEYPNSHYRSHTQDVPRTHAPFSVTSAQQPFVVGAQQPYAIGPVHSPFTAPHAVQPLPVDNIQKPTDPTVYQLIEDQNQHILKLYKTLETFLEKKQPQDSLLNTKNGEIGSNERESLGQQACNCSCKHIATQTMPSKKPVLRSVGTNTDLSWPEILSVARQNDKPFPNGTTNRMPINHRNVNQDELSEGVQRHFQMSENRAVSKLKNSVSFEQKCSSSEVKEISLTMREVVMTTIQEDQPSPEPSLHIDMEEYREDTLHDADAYNSRERSNQGNCMRSPELGESASVLNRNYQDYPHYDQRESDRVFASENPPTGTFYNNVMTNIQQILQSSKTAEEEEGEQMAEQNHHQQVEVQQATPNAGGEELLDPQIEAVRRQLLQFGISFIDPSSHASKHRPMLDTMYLPGLHNMLSMYQSTIVSPYQNIFKESDAMAAKYLTDTQLAAIASRSPVMKDRNQKSSNVQERDPPAYDPGDQFRGRNNLLSGEGHSAYDTNLSINTKMFLGKYGLRDNE